MTKKIFFTMISIFSSILFVSAENPFEIPGGLPGGGNGNNTKIIEKISSNIIAEMIKYVAVLAVLALMASGIMYMFSNGEEEKTKKAKTWIIWSLTAVVLSISSYYIVSVIAGVQIGL